MTTTIMRSHTLILGLAGSLVLALAGRARADFEAGVINIDVNADENDSSYRPESQGFPVFFSGDGGAWNVIESGDTAGSPLALTDATGAPTDVTIEWVNADSRVGHGSSPFETDPQFRDLMYDYLAVVGPGAATVTLAGLTPSTAYDLVLFSSGDNDVQHSTTFTVGGEAETSVTDGAPGGSDSSRTSTTSGSGRRCPTRPVGSRSTSRPPGREEPLPRAY